MQIRAIALLEGAARQSNSETHLYFLPCWKFKPVYLNTA